MEDDPIYNDKLWLDAEMVRYGDGLGGAGVGYCASYRPFSIAGNHSRAVLMLDTMPSNEESLLALAGRIALSCECVVLVPFLRGSALSWPLERLAEEVWAATRYLNGAHGIEALTVVSIGSTAVTSMAMMSEGLVGAHAAVALCPTGDLNNLRRVARDIPVPLLAVCGGGDDGSRSGDALREALALNSQVGRDYYVADFSECSADFVLRPQDAPDAKAAERALALLQSWVDQFLPENLGQVKDE